MDLTELQTRIAEIERDVAAALSARGAPEEVRRVETETLGKSGSLGSLLADIKAYPAEQRGAVGKAVNAAKGRIKARIDARLAELAASAAGAEQARAREYDPTLPGDVRPMGSVHPVTAVQWEVERLFERMGFTVEAGPEMETEYANFEALNIPETHPARDMQDTFWLKNGMVLRTHTSPVQYRSMLKFGAPLRVIAPGRCFRYETIDASHENTFHQIEGLMIDRDISLANLVAMAKTLLAEVMQREVKIRVRPGFFPFVEPGIEIDMNCEICGGSGRLGPRAGGGENGRGSDGPEDAAGEAPRGSGAGCATCKRSGWIEILPAGMVHPNVLKAGNIDPEEFTGFAFGLGLTRLAMMKFGIRDIRVLNSGDLRPIVSPRRLGGPRVFDSMHGASM